MNPQHAGGTATPGALAAICAGCRFFMHEPLALERALPGLTSLSSAFSSVRHDDGLCSVHERYVAASSSCARHSGAQSG
jgi:hypothetical protein